MVSLMKIEEFIKVPLDRYPLDDSVSIVYLVVHYVGSSVRVDGRRCDFQQALNLYHSCKNMRPDMDFQILKSIVSLQLVFK